MIVTTSEPQASTEGYELGRQSFERFLRDGEQHLRHGQLDDLGDIAAFFRAVPGDLRPAIAASFREGAPRRARTGGQGVPQPDGTPVMPSSAASTGESHSIVREPGGGPVGHLSHVDLFLEEVMIDRGPARKPGRHDVVFFDVTAIDATGAVATTSTRACQQRVCLPAAFCDRVLSTVEVGGEDGDVPRTISFEVAAVEGTVDRLPDLIAAARGYLRRELDSTLEARGGAARSGNGIMPPELAALVGSHTRGWLDALIAWSGELLPAAGKAAQVCLGGEAQFTATLTGPDLDYVYRNEHTGRRVEITGRTLVRSRPMVRTFSAGDEKLLARFRMGFRGSSAPSAPSAVDRRVAQRSSRPAPQAMLR